LRYARREPSEIAGRKRREIAKMTDQVAKITQARVDGLDARLAAKRDSRPRRIREIQDEYEAETGERPTKDVAGVIFDRECEAEYQRVYGGAYEYVEPEPPTCESGWTGDRCTFPLDHGGPHSNEERDPVEIYGTEEHEYWLLEMERREG
jgi:hypothetical protein